jgi:sugar phosphate isomerase/epimerase
MISRRDMIAGALSVPALFAKKPAGLKLGVMDGVVQKTCKPESVGIAKSLGLEGLQVTLGKTDDGKLTLSSSELQAAFAAESRKHGLPLVSTYIDALHTWCLKSDAKAIQLAADGIAITKKLNARILMLVFFGKCELTNASEIDAVVAPLKELSKEAEKAGVILGFENLISAADDIKVLDKVGSKAVQVYYDIGNATNLRTYVPAQEIRALGRDRICQFHFKDKAFLGEGKVDVQSALDAIAEIGFKGYAVFETNSPTKNMESDLRKNVDYVRKLIG